MKDLITAYEEEIQCFFGSRLICAHRLKWVRKLNIYIIFLVIFEIGAKNAQNQDFAQVLQYKNNGLQAGAPEGASQ